MPVDREVEQAFRALQSLSKTETGNTGNTELLIPCQYESRGRCTLKGIQCLESKGYDPTRASSTCKSGKCHFR